MLFKEAYFSPPDLNEQFKMRGGSHFGVCNFLNKRSIFIDSFDSNFERRDASLHLKCNFRVINRSGWVFRGNILLARRFLAHRHVLV